MRQRDDNAHQGDAGVRARMAELFQAFEVLESELKQHIKQLHIKRWERTAAALGLLSPVPIQAAASNTAIVGVLDVESLLAPKRQIANSRRHF
jgi:hypothetical protein